MSIMGRFLADNHCAMVVGPGRKSSLIEQYAIPESAQSRIMELEPRGMEIDKIYLDEATVAP